MTEERLEEIKDSIDFQLEVAKHIKADSVIECLNEEKELYNYVKELESINKEIREFIDNALPCIHDEEILNDLLDILNRK